MNMVSIEIKTKNNTYVPTYWSVVRIPEYLNMELGTRISWGRCMLTRNPPVFIEEYYTHMLRSDIREVGSEGTLKDCAGRDGNPGELVYRGRGMGVISIRMSPMRGRRSIKVRNGETPTSTEEALIDSQVLPRIGEYISLNKTRLEIEAIERTKKSAMESIKNVEDSLVKVREEMVQIVSKLMKGAGNG